MENIELPELANSLLLTKGLNEVELRLKIYNAVLNLLLNNTAYLYQVLYRIDVKEEKVKESFLDSPLVEVAAERITTLIVNRQIEKIQWRAKYSQSE